MKGHAGAAVSVRRDGKLAADRLIAPSSVGFADTFSRNGRRVSAAAGEVEWPT